MEEQFASANKKILLMSQAIEESQLQNVAVCEREIKCRIKEKMEIEKNLINTSI